MPWIAAIGSIAAGGAGAGAARRAGRRQQHGIGAATTAVQGGMDQALARIDAPVDTSLVMNQPYADAGIGAMANVNALLGIPQQSASTTDVSQYEGQLSGLTNKRGKIKDEIAQIKKLLGNAPGFNKGGYYQAGKYKGQHRDQLTNRLNALNEKIKTIDTEYKGIDRTYRAAVHQNDLITAANNAQQNAPGGPVQPIRAFDFEQSRNAQPATPTAPTTAPNAMPNPTGNGTRISAPTEFNFQFDENDPSYQWRLQQGLEAVNRSYAARGGLGSGNRMLGIMDYAQGLASTEYGAQFNRAAQTYGINANQYQNEFERSLAQWRSQFDVLNANLAGAGIGQRATGMNIDVLNNSGGNAANIIMSGTGQIAGLHGAAGQTGAAAILGSNNARQQTIGDLAYLAGQSGWFDDDNATTQVPYDPSAHGNAGYIPNLPEITIGG